MDIPEMISSQFFVVLFSVPKRLILFIWTEHFLWEKRFFSLQSELTAGFPSSDLIYIHCRTCLTKMQNKVLCKAGLKDLTIKYYSFKKLHKKA